MIAHVRKTIGGMGLGYMPESTGQANKDIGHIISIDNIAITPR